MISYLFLQLKKKLKNLYFIFTHHFILLKTLVKLNNIQLKKIIYNMTHIKPILFYS